MLIFSTYYRPKLQFQRFGNKFNVKIKTKLRQRKKNILYISRANKEAALNELFRNLRNPKKK